jgi:hypothetical protein
MIVRLFLVAGLLALAVPAPAAFATPNSGKPCKIVNNPSGGKLTCASGDDLGGGDSDAQQKGNDTGPGTPQSPGPRLTGQICKATYNVAVGRCGSIPGGAPQQRTSKTQCLANAWADYQKCLAKIR